MEVSVESVVVWKQNGWGEDTGVEKAGVRQEKASVEEPIKKGGGEREKDRNAAK